MPRRPRWFQLLAGCLVLVLVVSPYLIGRFIEQQLAYLSPSSPLQITQFERGWLTSEADSALHLPGLTLALKHRLAHGPVPLNGWRPAAAGLQTTLPSAECKRWGLEWELEWGLECGPTQPPVLDSLLYWNGASWHSADIAHLQAPFFSVHKLHAELHLPTLIHAQDWMDAKLQWQAERISYTSLALDDLTGNAQLAGANNLLNTHLLNTQLQVQAKKLIWQRHQWGDLGLFLQAERLDAVLVLNILTRNILAQQDLAEQLLALQNWLAQSPVLTLDQFTLDNERLSAKGYARLRPVNLWQLLRQPNLPSLLAALLASAELELRAERELAEQLLALWINGELSLVALQQAQQQLEHWSQAGFVRLQNNDYHAHLQYQDDLFSSD